MATERLLADTATFLRRFFEGAKLTINPTSRIGVMLDCLFDSDGQSRFISVNDPLFAAAKQAHRDLLQIGFIVDEIGQWVNHQPAKSKFRDLCKDSIEPATDRTKSSGRDAQCELYFAAICMKAGLKPVFNEPDIVCSYQSVLIGIAVKRIKSIESIENRIRGAAKQIFRSGKTGIIAADISLATNPDDQSVDFVVPDRQLAIAIKKRTDKFVRDYMTRFTQWVQHKWVSGIILVFNDLCAHEEEGYALESFTAGIAVSDNQRRRREFLKFFECFKQGLATKAQQRWK